MVTNIIFLNSFFKLGVYGRPMLSKLRNKLRQYFDLKLIHPHMRKTALIHSLFSNNTLNEGIRFCC